MSLERLTASAPVSHYVALHLHRLWPSNSAPPTTMPAASSAAGAESEAVDVHRVDPNGGEMLIAAAYRKAVRSPQQLRVSAARRDS